MTPEEFKKRLDKIINEAFIISEKFVDDKEKNEFRWESEGSKEADEAYDAEWASQGIKEPSFINNTKKSTKSGDYAVVVKILNIHTSEEVAESRLSSETEDEAVEKFNSLVKMTREKIIAKHFKELSPDEYPSDEYSVVASVIASPQGFDDVLMSHNFNTGKGDDEDEDDFAPGM